MIKPTKGLLKGTSPAYLMQTTSDTIMLCITVDLTSVVTQWVSSGSAAFAKDINSISTFRTATDVQERRRRRRRRLLAKIPRRQSQPQQQWIHQQHLAWPSNQILHLQIHWRPRQLMVEMSHQQCHSCAFHPSKHFKQTSISTCQSCLEE